MKCPACGAILEVTLQIGTDYSQTKALMDYASLKWRQSTRKPNLATILVTPDLLRVPLANELYNRLRSDPNFNFKMGEVTFKLSRNAEGTSEWLQKWTSFPER